MVSLGHEVSVQLRPVIQEVLDPVSNKNLYGFAGVPTSNSTED